jgi:branched-chain amino acid aminotransferase
VTRSEHPNSWIWLDGEFVRYQDARFGVMTHALHYGTGCFEGIRAYWNAAEARLHMLQPLAHYQRLHRSARVLTMGVPWTPEQLVEATAELLRRNEYREDAYVRPLVFKSGEIFGVPFADVAESVAIYTRPFGRYVHRDGGLRCKVSSWTRVPDTAIPARAKITGAYINSNLAKIEAQQAGFDEAIVLNTAGHVSEGSAENVFVLRNGVWATPAVTDDILEGITRRLLIGLIETELGQRVIERVIDRTELYIADEIFLCGTGAEVSPVAEVDRRAVGEGGVGPCTARLLDLYLKAARGQDSARADWTVPV